ncbi:class I SAM-dependent methyltransferase [Paenibacillus sanguinis]|uniref:class I SAM-dependent methyltransferase n=1 Tax=Paenibacillus sanguinis TaxID=225906 RepID=UPI000375764D|nr:class I SAM-dependent methyltransferase [Paenibacillus sanguinis]
MIITTGDHETPGTVQRARELAALSAQPYVSRSRTALPRLAERYGDGDILVILEQGARLHRAGQEPMTFHPSMAFVRAKRLLKGEGDAMLEAAGVMPGDTVLDATAGLGSDAMVFSLAVGQEGRVVALEDSLPLWALLYAGSQRYMSGLLPFDEALRRIEVRHAHHLQALRAMPDHSVDIVYFDPMFRNPIAESSSLSPLRSFANSSRLDAEAVKEACRVARKTVVLKEQKDSGEFDRLGFTASTRAHTKIAYGVISLDSTS